MTLISYKPLFVSHENVANQKNTSLHKNYMIYLIKEEELYQSKDNLTLVCIRNRNCKMDY